MKKLLILINISALICLAASKGTPQDEQAIRKLITDRVDAWNRHDAKAVSTFYTQDADFTPPPGPNATGREQIEKGAQDVFTTVFKSAKLTDSVEQIRFLRPDVAVLVGTFDIAATDLPRHPKGPQMIVVVKESGRWMIAAQQLMMPPPPIPPGGKQPQ